MDTLTVSEIFGPTIQGEGPSMGRHTGFLRLGRCNLNCSWCDTPFTWDWNGQNGTEYDPATELRLIPIRDVAATILEMGVQRLVITGGEPMIQQRKLPNLFALLPGVAVEIETNGTIIPLVTVTDRIDRYNVSPKLGNSGIPYRQRISDEAITAYVATGKADLKFVVTDDADIEEVQHLTERLNIPPHLVWIMPEGRTRADIIARHETTMDQAVKHGWNFSSRLHVLGWGDRRGV